MDDIAGSIQTQLYREEKIRIIRIGDIRGEWGLLPPNPPQKDSKVEVLKPLPSTWFFSDS